MRITTGIDIIEVDRIKKSIDEIGDAFLNKIYTKTEIEYCNKSKRTKYQHYAARFAAKEAVFKAISNCINGREDISWKDIEVINDKCGKPNINVESLKKNIIKTGNNYAKLQYIDISLSHIKDYAVASAVIVFE